MRLWRFIIIVGIIFILERTLPFFWSGSIFIFPVFAILYLVSSKKFSHDIPRIFFASLLFDVFSGFSFGIYTLAILATGLLIYIGKKRFVLGERSVIFGFIFTLLFVIIFFGMFSFELPLKYILSRLPAAIIESSIIYAILYIIMKRVRPANSKK
ncbi:MAG: hypothetical protein ABR875_01575 [Minisyncoccia bacterium]